jgi:hypothetical protein
MAKIGATGIEMSDKTLMIVIGIVIVMVVGIVLLLYTSLGKILKGFFGNLAKDFGLGPLFGLEERGHSYVNYKDNLSDSNRQTIITAANYFDLPSWILFRIGQIESGMNLTPHDGSAGEVGTFQIMDTVRIDFQTAVANGEIPFIDRTKIITKDKLREFNNNAVIAAWKLAKDYRYYQGNVENTIRAYNGGRGNRQNAMTDIYWNTFNSESLKNLYPEGT